MGQQSIDGFHMKPDKDPNKDTRLDEWEAKPNRFTFRCEKAEKNCHKNCLLTLSDEDYTKYKYERGIVFITISCPVTREDREFHLVQHWRE